MPSGGLRPPLAGAEVLELLPAGVQGLDGALGVLEDASLALCGIQGTCPPRPLVRPVVAVFAGDHGVHAQGVSPWPQEVTAAMVANFRAGGAAVICADHGNCETMIDPATGGPHTAHTTNPVPVIVYNGPAGARLRDGRLADLAPTVLQLMGLDKPIEMTGESLIVTS